MPAIKRLIIENDIKKRGVTNYNLEFKVDRNPSEITLNGREVVYFMLFRFEKKRYPILMKSKNHSCYYDILKTSIPAIHRYDSTVKITPYVEDLEGMPFYACYYKLSY